MKTLVLLCLVLTAFAIWWPLGVVAAAIAVLLDVKSQEPRLHDDVVSRKTTEDARAHEARADALQAENTKLQHELALKTINDLCDHIQANLDAVLEDKEKMTAVNPAYHAWQIVGDTAFALTWKAPNADPTARQAIARVLTYLAQHAQDLVDLVIKDPRWKLFAARELDWDDFRKMRGLAHVALDEALDLITRGDFGSVRDLPR